MAYAAPSSGTLLSTSSIVATINITSNTTGNFIRVSPRIRRRWSSKLTGIYASVSAPVVSSKPDDLVSSIISKVLETDRGVSLTRDEHKVVAELAEALKEFCVDEPVKCPLIFGEWDVVYCSVPTSPGGGYRSALGRIVFKTKEMIQAVEAPDIVQNKVAFSALGFLDGEVSLNGKLKALDEKWIQVWQRERG